MYLLMYPVHLALAGVALAYIAIKAGKGDADWVFWLSYGWIALQVLFGPRIFVPSALALAFVALQATQGDRDAIFWLCFTWLALMILGGGVAMRATRARRRKARQRAQAEATGSFESIFASMAGESFRWPPGASSTAEASDLGEDEETIEGTAREVDTELVDELERLSALHERGALTDAEFADAKRKLFE
ncbi:MAG: SHOCT domain-containing protein [Gaiellaceae bacterium]